MQSAAKRPVTQVNRLPASSASTVKEATEGDGRELWKKRRQMLREKRKEKRAKGPLIDPEVLKRINQEWQLIYGFTNRDLFHIENELENTVAKIRSVYSKKDKAIKFDDSVHVMFVEKENKGRRVKRSRKMEKHATKCDTESHSAAYIQFIVWGLQIRQINIYKLYIYNNSTILIVESDTIKLRCDFNVVANSYFKRRVLYLHYEYELNNHVYVFS